MSGDHYSLKEKDDGSGEVLIGCLTILVLGFVCYLMYGCVSGCSKKREEAQAVAEERLQNRFQTDFFSNQRRECSVQDESAKSLLVGNAIPTRISRKRMVNGMRKMVTTSYCFTSPVTGKEVWRARAIIIDTKKKAGNFTMNVYRSDPGEKFGPFNAPRVPGALLCHYEGTVYESSPGILSVLCTRKSTPPAGTLGLPETLIMRIF